MAGLNPWEQGATVAPASPDANAGVNPWESGAAYTPPANSPNPAIDQFNYDHDHGLYAAMNADREAGPLPDKVGMAGVQNYNDLYGDIEKDPKYQPVTDFENQGFGGLTGVMVPNHWTRNNDTNRIEVGPKVSEMYFAGWDGSSFLPTYKKASETIDPKTGQSILDLKNDQVQREQNIYNTTGFNDTSLQMDLPKPKPTPSILGLDVRQPPKGAPDKIGLTFRSQNAYMPNGEYDPTVPEDQDNNQFAVKKYLVDPPQRDMLNRVGAQIAKNIAIGTADFANEARKGKLTITGEGPLAKKFPDTVPNVEGEQLGTDIASFALGPLILGGAVKGVAGATAGAMGESAKLVTSLMDPSDVARIRSVYQTALKASGSQTKAFAVAKKFAEPIAMGVSLGAQEGIVARPDSQGIVSPEFLSEKLGVDRQRAQDISMMLDIPTVHFGLTIAGQAVKKAAAAGKEVFGGLRNVAMNRINAGPTVEGLAGRAMGVSDKIAATELYNYVDPGIFAKDSSTHETLAKLKIMSDLFTQYAQQDLKIGKTAGSFIQDSPAAYEQFSKQYFLSAYQHMKDAMPDGAFEKWVDDQAAESTNKMFGLRTARGNNPTNVKASKAVDDFLGQAADENAGGNLDTTLADTSQAAFDTQMTRRANADQVEQQGIQDVADNQQKIDTRFNQAQTQAGMDKRMFDQTLRDNTQATQQGIDQLGLEHLGVKNKNEAQIAQNVEQTKNAQLEADRAAELAKRGIQNDPEAARRVDELLSENPWGRAEEGPRLKQMGDVTYKNFEADRDLKNSLYQKVADSGAEGDSNSFLQLIKDGATDEKGNITDPLLKRVAESVNGDPSFANIWMNAKRDVSGALKRMTPNDTRRPLYEALAKNANDDQIKYLMQSDNADVADMAKEANDNFIKYWNTWKDYDPMKQISDEAGKMANKSELTPVAENIPQGSRNYDQKFAEVVKNNLSADDNGRFMEALRTANKGELDPHIIDHLSAKSLDNLAQSLADGSPQSISTLRQSLNETRNGIRRIDPNSPLLKKYDDLANTIDTLHASADEKAGFALQTKFANEQANQGLRAQVAESNMNRAQKEDALKSQSVQVQNDIFNKRKSLEDKMAQEEDIKSGQQALNDHILEQVKKQTAGLRKQADESVLQKFIANGDAGTRPVPSSEAGQTIATMFNGKGGTKQVENLLAAADHMDIAKAGSGEVLRDALKGAYLRNLQDKLFSRQSMGPIPGIQPMENAYRINTRKAEQMFAPGSQDLEMIKKIYKDNPDALKEIQNTVDALSRSTRSIPMQDAEKALTAPRREEDPAKATESAITFLFGVLNPTSAKIRRFAVPVVTKKLEDIKNAREAFLDKNVGSAAEMGKTGKALMEQLQKEDATRETMKRGIRATARAGSNALNTGDDRNIRNEMDKLK